MKHSTSCLFVLHTSPRALGAFRLAGSTQARNEVRKPQRPFPKAPRRTLPCAPICSGGGRCDAALYAHLCSCLEHKGHLERAGNAESRYPEGQPFGGTTGWQPTNGIKTTWQCVINDSFQRSDGVHNFKTNYPYHPANVPPPTMEPVPKADDMAEEELYSMTEMTEDELAAIAAAEAAEKQQRSFERSLAGPSVGKAGERRGRSTAHHHRTHARSNWFVRGHRRKTHACRDQPHYCRGVERFQVGATIAVQADHRVLPEPSAEGQGAHREDRMVQGQGRRAICTWH